LRLAFVADFHHSEDIAMQIEHLTVGGMSCGGCVTRVTAALRALPGVGGVEVALSTGKVDVSYDERLTQPAQMNSAIEKSGYSVGAAAEATQSKGCCG
jgi:copper chaperone